MSPERRDRRVQANATVSESIPTRVATSTHSTAPDALLHEIEQVNARAVALLRTADPIACALYEMGHRAGIEEGERRAAERAERAASAFLAYLAEDDECTPQPVPPIENSRRAA